MICVLCLKDITDKQESVEVLGRIRHKECSNKLEEMIEKLQEIYSEDKESDI